MPVSVEAGPPPIRWDIVLDERNSYWKERRYIDGSKLTGEEIQAILDLSIGIPPLNPQNPLRSSLKIIGLPFNIHFP